MNFKFFLIPKAVYFYCILPCLLIIIAGLIFKIIYSRKKDTYYYIFNTNYFLLIAGIIISAILMALLIGYSGATIYMILINEAFSKFYILTMILVVLPLIPLCLFVWLCFKLFDNLEYKKYLDENYENNQKEITVR